MAALKMNLGSLSPRSPWKSNKVENAIYKLRIKKNEKKRKEPPSEERDFC